MIEQNIQLTQKIWRQLNLSWVLFFTVMGFTNLFVLYNFNTDVWVNFKLFGTLGLTVLFIIAQGIYMAKHQKPATTSANEPALEEKHRGSP